MQFILEGGEIEKPIPKPTDYPGSNYIPLYIYIFVEPTDYPLTIFNFSPFKFSKSGLEKQRNQF